MRIQASIVMPMIWGMLCSVAPAQYGRDVNETLADNAALAYWQAFSLMPELDEAEANSLNDLLAGKEPDQGAIKIVRQATESLRLLRRAANFKQCEWGLEYERGAEMGLSHLSQARKISKLACARARLQFATGNNRAAIDDVLAAMTLARTVGQDAIIISLLVQYAMEDLSIDVLRRYLPKLKPPERDLLAAGIEELPESRTMADAWRTEKELLLEWFIRQLRKPAGQDRVMAVFGDEQDPNVVALSNMSQEDLLAAAVKLRAVYDQIAETITRPPSEVEAFVEELTVEADSLGQAKHLGALLIPAITSNRRAEAVYQTKQVMLSAAIAVVRDGQLALNRSGLRDPFAKGPLQYSKMSQGFQLSSALTGRDGNPVSLVVGEQ